MKKLLVLLLILCMLLVACAPVTNTSDTTGNPSQSTGDPNQTTGDPNQTTGDPNQTTGDPNQTTGDPNQTTGDPNPPVDPEDPRLAEFDALFGDFSSWYNKGLTAFFINSSEINLKMLFYRGFTDESGKLTDAEREALQGKVTLELDVRRLPVEKMDQVLSRYLGITLEELDASNFQGLVYLESTNCYYFATGDVEVVENFKATKVEDLTDGTVRLYYTASSRATGYAEAACVVILKKVNGQWQILSNQRAQ